MKDGPSTEVSRQELYDDYVNRFLQLCPEVGPCRDALLLERAAQYLLREPELAGTFTLFPFQQAVGPDRPDRKHLTALIRAAELLETVCSNLMLQPWRREIRTLKTFTGPFVYCLLPVLSPSTLQSVLASIGYLLHTDSSEYRLSEDVAPHRALLLGFELLLVRLECRHLLELLDQEQLGAQEWLEVLQRRVGPTNPEEPTEQKTATRQKEEEEKKRKEGADRKEVHVRPQPKPRRCHVISADRSIMELQMTYDDLAFRGRPLLPDRPDSSSSTDLHDDRKSIKCAAVTVHSEADEVFGDDVRGGGGGDSDGNTADDQLRAPPTVSLHLTLRAGAKAEPSPEPELHTAAERPQLCSLSSVDEMQELKELAERMGQEVKRSEDKTDKERKKRERQASTERETGETQTGLSDTQSELTVLL